MGEEVRTSSDLIRWLKMLALPTWAKAGLALIMLLTLSNALGLMINGMLTKDKDAITAGVTILTVGLPVGLIVVALVFGDGGARKLRQMTERVLNQEVPQAIRENLTNDIRFVTAQLEARTQGYITDYTLRLSSGKVLRFRLELNIRKVNVVFWLNDTVPRSDARAFLEDSPAFRACLIGAEREGYVLNPIAQNVIGESSAAVVFIKELHHDFLLEPAQRLYFAQDLSFFVRGMLDAADQYA